MTAAMYIDKHSLMECGKSTVKTGESYNTCHLVDQGQEMHPINRGKQSLSVGKAWGKLQFIHLTPYMVVA